MGQQETIPQPFKYVGQLGVFAEEGHVYYMRARYYDAEVGRFILEDPVGFQGGLNLYAYAANNPVMFSDPSGNCPWCFGAIVGGVIGGGANAIGTYYSGGDFGEIVTAVSVGAGTGALFGATGGAAGSVGVWVGTGVASGAITSGATTAINGGSFSESVTSAAVGGATGLVAGVAGHRIALGSALSATRRGSGLASSIIRGDHFGGLGGAVTGITASSAVNAARK